LIVWITNTRCTVLKTTHSSGWAEIIRMLIIVAVRCFIGYKYLLRLSLITISQFSFLSWLGFTFLILHLQSMEYNRGTKRAHSPSKEGGPLPDGAKTPPPAPFGSLPPLMTPPEVSSRRPRSPVLEQGGSSMMRSGKH
jgi:hypothetical protein